jgi:hypothetical protein
MFRFRLSKLGSFILPLALLLQISLPDVALCIGSDGHAAIESYSGGQCDEINPDSSYDHLYDYYSEALTNSNHSHCGTCIDIPFSDKNTEFKVSSSNNLMPEIEIHQFVLYQISPQVFFETSNHATLVQESHSDTSILKSLRTTVLTC